MSERVRQSLVSSLFASKRFVVAACAAVAMVLGALSGGASFFGGGTPTPAPAEHSSLIFGPNPDENSAAQSPTPVKQSPLTTQHTLEVRNVLVPPPNSAPAANKSKGSGPSGLSLINPNNVASTVNALFLSEVQLPIGAPTDSTITTTTSATASTGTGGDAQDASTSSETSSATTTTGDSTTSSDSGTTTITTTAPPDSTTTPQSGSSTAPFAPNNTTPVQPQSTTNP